jgi:hypothetical protein
MRTPLKRLAWALNVARAWPVRGSSATRKDPKGSRREYYAGLGLYNRMVRLVALRTTHGPVVKAFQDVGCRMISTSWS